MNPRTAKAATGQNQRQRLLDAMIHLSASEGYAGASIAKVITQAGISRPTFYEHFRDKDDCFLAALTEAQQELSKRIRGAIAEDTPSRAAHAALDGLLGFAAEHPDPGRVAILESMASGPAMDARERSLADIEQAIEQAQRPLPEATPIPDISSHILIGGVQRLLSARIRAGETSLTGIAEDLHSWLASYTQPKGTHRWRNLEPGRPPIRTAIPAALVPPPPLPAGGKRASSEQVEENHRQRIIFATAEISRTDGYNAATIAAITRRAGLDSRAFHRIFKDKQHAFAAVQDMYFQHMMAVTASAFINAEDWPGRIWEGGKAFAQSLEENPTLAQVAFVQSHTGGPIPLQRVDATINAFTMFLKEGYQHKPNSGPKSPVALQATVNTIFEIVHHQTLADPEHPKLTGMQGHCAQIALAPFLGSAEANLFIEQRLADATKP
jgi:AcrR family transcriptional regulator